LHDFSDPKIVQKFCPFASSVIFCSKNGAENQKIRIFAPENRQLEGWSGAFQAHFRRWRDGQKRGFLIFFGLFPVQRYWGGCRGLTC